MPVTPQHVSGEVKQRSQAVKAKALELGFQAVGIARAEVLLDERQQLEEWLHRGFHGEMPYMARDPEQRTDLQKIFPEARSVIAVAMNYYTPHQHVDDDNVGHVSRYAWGDDYHEVVGEKLRELLEWIKQQWPEAEGKVCVDIQPVMDKAWAARAGLGWMGKHTNVITRAYGSWVFLGELLLNLELEYEADQIADQCGSCTLCLDECPTGAIVEPYVLDANLCISHATIESRAATIRADVAERLDGWLYGCDVCQDVCPWNHTTPVTLETRFEPRERNVNASLVETLELTPESYAARFRGSAMKRAKLAGLQRNARALLENSTQNSSVS
ncbi:MAG TPA: tRNA epoxyqueuosine(34) reductase QueG [Pyrinomonadaceae bacterium]|nr:tRNA epoxyqueuosine(34) reductase QueG [Pyrinomonadaceae bacterium]